eukprot:c18987_g1_i3 orf=1-390(-)
MIALLNLLRLPGLSFYMVSHVRDSFDACASPPFPSLRTPEEVITSFDSFYGPCPAPLQTEPSMMQAFPAEAPCPYEEMEASFDAISLYRDAGTPLLAEAGTVVDHLVAVAEKACLMNEALERAFLDGGGR